MNTRVAVPLSPEGYAAVSTISKIAGKSRGRLLADALDLAMPSFIRIAQAMRAVEALQADERREMIKGLSEAESRLLDALSSVDDLLGETIGRKPHTQGAGAPMGVRAQRADPPVTNRGVPTDE